MYEIRDNQVVKIAESVTPVTSAQIEEEINSLKLIVEDMNIQVKILEEELTIVKNLESQLTGK
jgi:hypothetical protein